MEASVQEARASFMNGVPELLLLRLIQEREMYGYELVQAICDQTETAITLGEGVVYPVLHALERDGALKSRRKSVNGRSRVYYSVTEAGSHRLADLVAAWTKLNVAISSVLKGSSHAQAI